MPKVCMCLTHMSVSTRYVPTHDMDNMPVGRRCLLGSHLGRKPALAPTHATRHKEGTHATRHKAGGRDRSGRLTLVSVSQQERERRKAQSRKGAAGSRSLVGSALASISETAEGDGGGRKQVCEAAGCHAS